MEKTEIKSALIDACRKKLLDTIANLETAMTDAQQQANDYGPPKDRYDSFRAQLMRRRDMMAQQLSKELNELNVLERINPKKKFENADFGAIVFTNEQNYFISVGLGKTEIDNVAYYAISPMVPISQIIIGRKKDDRVAFRDKKIHILDIF